MREYSEAIQEYEKGDSKEPRFVLQLSWDDSDTDFTYFTSSLSAKLPATSPPVDSISGVFTKVSGQTQKINPDIATSTIGGITILLQDTGSEVTNKINEKLEAGDGLRGKIARVYVGYQDMPFSDYDLRLTYIVDSISYLDGRYEIKLADVQRVVRKKIFTPDESNLNASITENSSVIPVTTSDANKFPLITHGAEWQSRPSETVGYIKIDKEVICHDGLSFSTTFGWYLTSIERGALNTRAAVHNVDASTENSRKPKVIEHVYLEGASPKVIYALLTGILLNGNSPESALPDHWHLGVSASFVKLSDFQLLGLDFWDTADDSGRFVRIENPGSQDGKGYIEKEMLLWLGAFMPVYSTGELGIKRLTGVLSDSSYQVKLNKYNVASYSAIQHDMRSVINDIRIHWNWVDLRDSFTKESLLIDADSIGIHGVADEKVFKFKTVHTGLHTDEDLLTYFDVLRDRYSGPPLIMSLDLLPSMSRIEVGDVVNVFLDQARDFTTGTSLNRPFEVQQVSTDWMTGRLKLSLFGSSQKAGELTRTELSTVLLDEFYTNNGTSLDSSDSPAGPLTIVAGAVTVNGTITGHVSDVDDSTAIYYYDGDLTINAGVTVTIEENVQLRIRGSLQINGAIEGVGNGATGGAATTLFAAGGVAHNFNLLTSKGAYIAKTVPAYHEGEAGYFGTTIAPGDFRISGGGYPPPTNSTVIFPPLNNPSSQGAVSVVPFYQLTNDQQSSTITGYAKDLRGNSGISGEPFQYIGLTLSDSTGTQFLLGDGGAGGNGGAGLLIIARGIAFGGSGKIDLSGGDSSIGTSYSHAGAGKIFYGSAGAPGAPGALLLLLDGDTTNPDIDGTNFIANYGDTSVPAFTDEIGSVDFVERPDYFIASQWDHALSVWNLPNLNATELISMSGSAHKIIYIPPDETPVDDDSNFPDAVDGLYRDLLFHQRDEPPIAETGYGREVDITDDGSRFISSGFSSTVAVTVQVVRSVSNPFEEQSISDPATPTGSSTGWGNDCRLSDDGDRLFSTTPFSKPGALDSQGEIWIYSRAGVTWSLEQTLAAGTPRAGGQFGLPTKADGLFESLIAVHDDGTTNEEVQYWTRSGTVWSYQSKLPLPPGASSGFGWSAIDLSSDGNYVVAGDGGRTVGGVANVGAAYLFKLSGSSFVQIAGAISPIVGKAYQWGGTGVAISGDGSSFAVGGSGLVAGDLNRKIAIYHRVGDSVKLIQVIVYYESSAFPRPLKFSENGLLFLSYDSANGIARIYKRGSVSQGFKIEQTIENRDDGAWGVAESFSLSRKGGFLITGNTSTDVGASSSGSVHAYQFTNKAE